MALRITTNIPALTAQRSLDQNQRSLQTAMAQISTGSRITKASDDAAGLSISETLNANIRSYQQASRNTQDGISLIQVAEGALGEVSNIITRFRELAIQAGSDTIGDRERSFIQREVDQMKNEVERIAQSTKFGDKFLLNGEGDIFDFQVGIGAEQDQNVVSFDASETDATLSTLSLSSLDFSDKGGAIGALADIDEAQTLVNGYRANLGAFQNRLVSTTENIGSAVENISAAKSRMSDADLAESSSTLAKNNILLNASTAILAQANLNPQQALRLVG